MKKVLFTLATLFAFGLTANAQGKPAPVLAFGYDANNLVTEIEMAPGEQQELHVVIVEQQEKVVQGFQLQWLMKNSAGEPETTGVTCPKIYGGRTKTWTNPEGFSLPDENVGGVTGNSLASQILEGYIYRWVGTNTSANQFWFNSDADGNLAAPNAVGAFTVVTSADWNDDYATFEFDQSYAIYNQTPSDQPADGVNNYEVKETQPMVLKIINKNKLTPAHKDVLNGLSNHDIAQLVIASQAEVTEETYQEYNASYVKVEKFLGHTCPRCWNVVTTVNEDGLCERCQQALAK